MATDDELPVASQLTREVVFAVLGALGALVTIATAIMYYFGWRRSEIQAQLMEMDVSLFAFSTQDYVIRGLGSLYAPALLLCALAIGWIALHRFIVRQMSSARFGQLRRHRLTSALRWAQFALVVVAAACILYTWEGATESPRWPVPTIRDAIGTWRWIVPALLVITTLTASYISWIRLQLVAQRPRPLWETAASAVVVAAIVGLGLFWILEDYATIIGRRNAILVVGGVNDLPRATVVSDRSLHVDIDSVDERPLPGGGYETTGLRFLTRSGGKIILVHDDWAPGAGTMIVLPDSDEFVWQLQR